MRSIRKYSLFFLLLIITLLPLYAQNDIDERVQLGLLGSVSGCTVIENELYETFGETKEYAGEIIQEYSFDLDGRILKSLVELRGGFHKYEYLYDRTGRIIEFGVYRPEARHPDKFIPVSHFQYKYENDGQLLKKTTLSILIPDAFPSAIETFDDDGNLIDYTTFKSNGEILSKDKYVFSNGLCTEYQKYNEYGAISGKYNYTYNPNGNLIEKNLYSSDGTLRNNTEYAYDSFGNNISESFYNSDGKMVSHFSNQYDNNNLIESRKSTSSGSIYYLDKYVYSENSNLILGLKYRSKSHFNEKRYVAVKSNYIQTKKEYTYNINGNVKTIEGITYFIDGFQKERWIKHFNDLGLIIEEEVYADNNKLIYSYIYGYEYDLYNNWISKLFIKKTIQNSIEIITEEKIVYREINYY